MMKTTTKTCLVLGLLTGAATFAGCSDDTGPIGGTGGSGTGGVGAGATGGSGGTIAGTGGGESGSGGSGLGGAATGGGAGETGLGGGTSDCDDADPTLPTGFDGSPGTGIEGYNFSSAGELDDWGVKEAQYGGDNAFDEVALSYDCGSLVATVTWPHEVGWEGDAPAEANKEITKAFLEVSAMGESFAGKRVTLTMSLTDMGASTGGFDVYISLSDADWTSWPSGGAAGEFTAAGTKTFTIDVPGAPDGDFDPSSIQQVNVRVDNKYWGAGEPFDYGVSVFEIDSMTWEDSL